MEHAPAWLLNSFIYLAAAVIAVPLSRALGLGAIIGYLGAGMAIGPWGLGLVGNVDDILHFAEFGVVLMLFLVGLELEPRRLWSLRRPIFGWGSAYASWPEPGSMTRTFPPSSSRWHRTTSAACCRQCPTHSATSPSPRSISITAPRPYCPSRSATSALVRRPGRSIAAKA